jgi:hydrogenase 3 maturation protease
MKYRLIQDPDILLVLDAGHVPENCTADLRSFAPELVLLIDAAQMDEPPGTIRWIDMEDMDGLSASTHSMPLSMLADYLSLELDCEIKLLSIQPRSNEVGETVATEVMQGVDIVVEEFIRLFEHALKQYSNCLN